MPQVSNLSWFYSSSLSLIFFLIIALSINYLGLFSLLKTQIFFVSRSNFSFLI